ncbi:formylglycine-generating enzyme family protein [Maribacter ulvicola]|uniref:Formylglycine-generating enzyme, required for sulfatase activity, contains SUMF1/FGE domain n=1 Tax=Maribacter ulvicola TaxID=228959 RepID=A0A1N6RWT1_9FLAO|nr:formylglycine-generating enzyme family protein [Maribacter ulvicola]SIQ33257.1 Formylglycine-generating enzyme, required for sulfatase activity, contains SUMF1/FGE domain [Maribacter ulvicola]
MNFVRTILPLACFLLINSVNAQQEKSKNFTETINGSTLQIEMVAIPKGSFTMGSEKTAKKRNDDEGPAHSVSLDEFWISKYEITWEIYNLFVNREIDNVDKNNKAKDINVEVDAISGATIPYVDMSLGMGTSEGLPVANVTQYAASQFCKWLSAKTGHFYRLPTEAEWEYSARAGTTTAYSFGDDPSQLKDYAWYYENSDNSYHKVGLKQPNPWGLYDMHGNVAEWTIDHYLPEIYESRKKKTTSPVEFTHSTYPRSVRGGSYDDDPEYLRSAARLGSNENWKMRDPQFPKSKWWNTDAPFVGFRIVRDPKVPNEQEINNYWGD